MSCKKNIALVLPGLVAVVLLWSCSNPLTIEHASPQTWDQFSSTQKLRELQFAFSALKELSLYQDKVPDGYFEFDNPVDMYNVVEDPYTQYLYPIEAKFFLNQLTTQRGGMGIRTDYIDSGIVIKRVFANTPAQRAGLMKADTVVSVDGVNIVGIDNTLRNQLLQGEIGETKTLGIKRSDQMLIIKITLGEYIAPSVVADTLDSITIHIEIFQFADSTSLPGGTIEEFKTILQAHSWAKQAILDLRYNPGGFVGQANDVIATFVAADMPLYRERIRSFDEQRNRFYTVFDTVFAAESPSVLPTAGKSWVILQNQYSASASELLITALRHNRPDIKTIGSTTFGKARMQVGIDTYYQGLCKITSGELLPVKEEQYDLVGIEADITAADGNEVDAALDYFYGAQHTLSKGRRLRQPTGVVYDELKSMLPPAAITTVENF